VPFLLAGRAVEGVALRPGVLADVAPTLCELVGLPRWEGMTGQSLLTRSGEPPVLSSAAVSSGGRPQ